MNVKLFLILQIKSQTNRGNDHAWLVSVEGDEQKPKPWRQIIHCLTNNWATTTVNCKNNQTTIIKSSFLLLMEVNCNPTTNDNKTRQLKTIQKEVIASAKEDTSSLAKSHSSWIGKVNHKTIDNQNSLNNRQNLLLPNKQSKPNQRLSAWNHWKKFYWSCFLHKQTQKIFIIVWNMPAQVDPKWIKKASTQPAQLAPKWTKTASKNPCGLYKSNYYRFSKTCWS